MGYLGKRLLPQFIGNFLVQEASFGHSWQAQKLPSSPKIIWQQFESLRNAYDHKNQFYSFFSLESTLDLVSTRDRHLFETGLYCLKPRANQIQLEFPSKRANCPCDWRPINSKFHMTFRPPTSLEINCNCAKTQSAWVNACHKAKLPCNINLCCLTGPLFETGFYYFRELLYPGL